MISMGNRIKKSRELAGLTQEEVAEKVGVSRTAVTRWEQGEIEPKISNLVEIANVLNVSTDYLLGTNTRECSNGLNLSGKAELALQEFVQEIRNENKKK